LEAAARELVKVYDWPHLSLGQDLAAALFSMPAADRARRAHNWTATTIGAAAPGPLLLTEIALLFDPVLQLDVLALLQQASRATRLVVAWPGTFQNHVLAYAVPEHRHYRTWPRPEVSVVPLD
jgi:hypothetical protein